MNELNNNISTGVDPLCGYCGRPVVGFSRMVYSNGLSYHMECTYGPSHSFDRIIARNPEQDLIESLQKRVAILEDQMKDLNTKSNS